MKHLLRLIIILLCVAVAVPTFAGPPVDQEPERVVQCFFNGGNLRTMVVRLNNQYDVAMAVAYDEMDDDQTIAGFRNAWPKSLGDHYTTRVEVDADTGDYNFNMQVSEAVANSFPRNDTPNFTVTCTNEVDAQGESTFVLPTYKATLYDESGTPVGTYDRDVTVMR